MCPYHLLTSNQIRDLILGVVLRIHDQWSSTVLSVSQLPAKYDERLQYNIMGWLRLDINTAGCLLSGLVVTHSRKTEGLEFESHVRDHRHTLVESHTRKNIATQCPQDSNGNIMLISIKPQQPPQAYTYILSPLITFPFYMIKLEVTKGSLF